MLHAPGIVHWSLEEEIRGLAQFYDLRPSWFSVMGFTHSSVQNLKLNIFKFVNKLTFNFTIV